MRISDNRRRRREAQSPLMHVGGLAVSLPLRNFSLHDTLTASEIEIFGFVPLSYLHSIACGVEFLGSVKNYMIPS